jgi:catechol 2,3-dioxygenase-like lactoylglutathione lyase family enzyme
MTVCVDHIGLLVEDVQRAGDFYCHALGTTWLLPPIISDGPAAELVMGERGVRFRLGMVRTPGGTVIELFAFQEGPVPQWAHSPTRGRLPHVAFQVDDTAAALQRVEDAGGRRLWDAVAEYGPAHVVYAVDPDGNVVELLDRPIEDVAHGLRARSA